MMKHHFYPDVFNSIATVCLRFGASYTDDKGNRRGKLQDKSPTMFSQNALAYWINSSTTHIGRVLGLAKYCSALIQTSKVVR